MTRGRVFPQPVQPVWGSHQQKLKARTLKLVPFRSWCCSKSRQACEPRPVDPLVLNQHLKFFSQSFGMNQILQEQTRFQLLEFRLTGFVQIRKLIFPAQGDQELGLRYETRPNEARPAST